jgi:RNA polymerase sigma-70 factor (sigma-E family)
MATRRHWMAFPLHVTFGRLDRSFDDFVVGRSSALLRTAVLLCGGDRYAAEDMLQVALLRLARHWHRGLDRPEAYVRRVLVNLAQDRARDRRRRPVETGWPEGAVPALRVADPTEHDDLMQAVRDLPARQRAVLVLRVWDDLTVEETAEALGCSPGTVKSYTSRALARLRQVLERSDHAY